MSNAGVQAALEEMETWLSDPTWEPEPESLTQWNNRYQKALAQADKAEGWPRLADKAHALGQLLEDRLPPLVQLRNEIKTELKALESGNRAMLGYGAGVR